VLAPIIIRGAFDSYVIGVLSLDQIQEYLDKRTHENAMLYTLLDKNGKIIMSNHPDQTVMQPLMHQKGTVNRLDDKISQWVPTLPRNTPISERWTKSNYITEVAIGDLAEWKLILEQPVAPFQKVLYGNYTGKLSLLFLILLSSLVLAELFTHRAIFTLRKLLQITQDLPVKLVANDKEIVWPESGIKEANHLINNFMEMSDALVAVFAEKQQMNEVLEQRVQERTNELRESEERFRNMFQKHSAMMLLIEPESGAIIDANLAAENFYGYSHETMLTMNIGDINTHSRESITLERRRAQEEERNYFIFPHRIASGKVRTVEVHSTPIRLDNLTLLFSIIHDITERRQAEDALREAKEAAESATLAKSRFLSIVAHEFQTPLHLLTISTDILDQYEGRLSIEEQLEQRTQIRNAARQMSALIDSVSSINRLEKTVYSLAPVLLEISQTCSIISGEINTVWGKDHDFNVSISADCGTGTLDEILFRRILENLLTNAFRFTPAGGSVSLTVDRQGDRLQIEVADSGIGIPEVDQERIFEAFYRSSNVDARKGLGLGLSIVSEALKELNGSITLTSRVGVGSTFRVELPVNIRSN
jgi:PAS domain S-box-containing protein